MVRSVFKVINIKKSVLEGYSLPESSRVRCQHWEEAQFPVRVKSIRLL